MSALTDKAKEVIAEGIKLPEERDLKEMIERLKGELEYGLARKILKKARKTEKGPDFLLWITQQLALCTYKDEEIQPSIRFKDALAFLDEIGLRSESTNDAETLALGGAVYKRKWETEGRTEYLYNALAFYSEAWERNPEQDMGCGGVNAAYILDLLAFRSRVCARRTATKAVEADSLAEKAKRLREDMATRLPEFAEKKRERDGKDLTRRYWFVVTLAEIYFGLEEYDRAKELLSSARDMKAMEWEQETTFRQLVNIAMLHGETTPKGEKPVLEGPWKTLAAFFSQGGELAFSCTRGRVGLALSGGGFRASFYHLGVLARLAEMDVLRSVEVLSTVSGGSIVGALYYLEVQHLLNTNKDIDIIQDDYRTIVERIQGRFLEGVQRNLRVRTVSSLPRNLKMIFSKEYSRSHRIGELYETELYSRVSASGVGTGKARSMPELIIRPAEDHNAPFKPRYMNWRRRAKVPVLLLNATSLNTGHNWHFTASWMGESPGLVDDEIGMIGRYRRLYYSQALKEDHKNYRLGYAVAASACVPGLFEPLALEGLYPGKTVQLVDGGVHDNQGVQGLLNEGCNLVLCSDASGQMDEKERPSDNILGVPLRSNSILMDRVRESEYQNLRSRVEISALKGLFFVHLKKGLDPQPIDWTSCQDPTVPPEMFSCTTGYGIDKELQRKLADIRTDLDSFTEVEAFSLMLSGYLMTEDEFKELDRQYRLDGGQGTWGDFIIDAPRSKWPFLELEKIMRQPPKSADARRKDIAMQLDAASSRAFKIWRLDPMLKTISWAGAAAVLIALGWFLNAYWRVMIHMPSISVSGIALFFLLIIAGTLFPIIKWLTPEKAMRSIIWKFVVAVIGCIASNVHLGLFDGRFKSRGSLERLLKLK